MQSRLSALACPTRHLASSGPTHDAQPTPASSIAAHGHIGAFVPVEPACPQTSIAGHFLHSALGVWPSAANLLPSPIQRARAAWDFLTTWDSSSDIRPACTSFGSYPSQLVRTISLLQCCHRTDSYLRRNCCCFFLVSRAVTRVSARSPANPTYHPALPP